MNETVTDQLRAAALAWLEHDPDPSTRTEIADLIDRAQSGDADALGDLSSRFSGPLTFGTAGLRAAVGAGESRMNVAVVIRATAGLAAYLHDVVGADARVVVGCDARHGSSEFMDAALEVISGAGLGAIALPKRLPTPVTAYAVRVLDADAGIMITASHNPPADNGYKVYLGGRAADAEGAGVQIVPPADAEIASRIAAAPPADEVPRSTETIVRADPSILDGYVTRVASYRTSPAPSGVRVVFTAMHGVGAATALRVLAAAGVPDVHPVPEQREPDPSFPTVAFPNPEEPGALDRSIALAREVNADLVIALDPDADRCSVATEGRDGSWRQLTGDEVGALLGEQAAADDSRSGDTLACSLVSSRLLGRIAAAHGLSFAHTLTGFKWIARTPGLRYGYEEAIGYCTDPQAVADKDGIGAAVRIITLVDALAAAGKTLDDQLDHLALTYGLHATGQRSFRVGDPALIAEAMARLRTTRVDELAGSVVVDVVDLAKGSPQLPPSDGVIYRTEADDRVVIRPSGTEPKLKCYIEVVTPVGDGEIDAEEWGHAVITRAAAAERIQALGTAVTRLLGF